jgi:hypothetical protein
MEIIQQLVLESSQRPAANVIGDLIDKKPKAEALQTLQEIISHATQVDEQVIEIIHSAWMQILERRLWEDTFDSLEQLEQVMGYTKLIEPIIQQRKKTDREKLAELKSITARWHLPVSKIFPAELQPDCWSRNLLLAIRNLAERVPKPEEAIKMIQEQVDQRLSKSSRGRRTKTNMTLRDVQNVIQGFFRLSKHGQVQNVERSNRSSSSEDEDYQSDESSNDEEAESPNGEGDSTDGDGSNADGEDSQDMKHAGEELSEPRFPSRQESPKISVIPSCDGCHSQCYQFLGVIPRTRMEHEPAMVLLARTREVKWINFCKPHLRLLAGYCCGLYNNRDSAKANLIRRMELVLKYRDQREKLVMAHPEWFRKAERSKGIRDRLGPYMWQPSWVDAFSFDAPAIFNRYAKSNDAWGQFQRDGTININDFFEFLLEPEIFEKIEEEFDLYKYHLRDGQDGQVRRGWMRHMFYSLVQQLIRQDPAYWAIMAAARPDKNWRMISYPYYTKDTTAGESTGFAHLDINVEKFVESGRGGNIIQGSMSLDDEDECGCTILVLGFHQQIQAWWERVRQRGLNRSGHTTNAKTIYLPEDERLFGKLTPVPCKRGAIRITRPEILHGSTSKAVQRRRTVFVWHYGIREDHETLDLEEAERWSDLVRCHQGFQTPEKSTSGEGFRYGRPLFPFPGTTKLGSTSLVGDAMVGARRWDDPRVMEERDILLGNDTKAAWELVEEIRARLKKEFLKAFPFVRIAEMRAYGARSFYRNLGGERPPPEEDRSGDISMSELSLEDEL